VDTSAIAELTDVETATLVQRKRSGASTAAGTAHRLDAAGRRRRVDRDPASGHGQCRHYLRMRHITRAHCVPLLPFGDLLRAAAVDLRWTFAVLCQAWDSL
jgi:hypothetical protein